MKPFPRRIHCVAILLSLALSSGCASAPASSKSPTATSSDSQPKSEAESARELAHAQKKLEIAELELSIAQARGDDDLSRKEQELALSKSELAQFDELDAPNRIANAKLALTRSVDSLSEQEEELAQLEMTYAEVDLSDKTREIVLNRNRRRVERAKEELAIQQRETEALQARVLPRERAKLALEVDSKGRELETARREGRSSVLGKELALDEARAEVAKLEKAGAKP